VGKIFRLKKALYGCKQAAFAWQKYLSQIFFKMGGKRHLNDECVYLFAEGSGWVIIGTHVDDMFPLFNREGRALRDKILATLQKHMTIDNKGTLSFALDTKIERDAEAGILKISQPVYLAGVVSEFNQENSFRRTPSSGPDLSEEDLPTTEEEKQAVAKLPVRNVIGRLWWLALISRPDIQCALHKCALWQNKPSRLLWRKLGYIVQYLAGTPNVGLVYKRPRLPFSKENPLLSAMCDSSFASEPQSRSRFGWFFNVAGGLVSWDTKVSSRVMTSSTEAECHGLVALGKENIWQRDFQNVLGFFKNFGPTLVFQDNSAAIRLATEYKVHKRSKHFGVEFNSFREYVEKREMEIVHRSTDELAADMLTKSLPADKFIKFRDMVMGDSAMQDFFHPQSRVRGERGGGFPGLRSYDS